MIEQKKRAALLSVFASTLLATLKLIVGLLTGSLGILSEATHSILDILASTITYFAVRMSSEPADDEHHYGHGKIESLSAFIEAGILLATALWIIHEAITRLIGSENPIVDVEWYSIAVIIVSLIVDIFRYFSLNKVAKATESHALEADALHFSTDIISSIVVLIGLLFLFLGYQKADAIAALGVSVFIIVAAWNLGKNTIDVLMDVAPLGLTDNLRKIFEAYEEIVHITLLRARLSGPTIYVDASLSVSRTLSHVQIQDLRLKILSTIKSEFPKIEMLLVVEPIRLDRETLIETVRIIAMEEGLDIHNIAVVIIEGKTHIAFDLEVEENQTILVAHDIAHDFEDKLSLKLGQDICYDIHITPKKTQIVTGRLVTETIYKSVETLLAQEIGLLSLVKEVHGLIVQESRDGFYIAFHLIFSNELGLKEVHATASLLEHRLREKMPHIARIAIHTEPEDHVDIMPHHRESKAFCGLP